MTSFVSRFYRYRKRRKVSVGDELTAPITGYSIKITGFIFGDDQLMRTGWIQKDGTWYYAADTGELQGGIMKINGNVYYFDTSTCKMVTGNYSYNGGTHEFTENGTTDGGPYVYNEWNSNGIIKRGTKFGVR